MSALAPHSTPPPTAPAPNAACAHCGLPVGDFPVGSDPFFCCTGCAVVYDALQTAGLGDTYYRLRDVAPPSRDVRPAQTDLDALVLSEMDSPRFLDDHTRPIGDTLREAELFVDGVHCAACVWLVERIPYEIDGVEDARLDLPRARLTLRFRPEAVQLSAVARWLARFGYETQPARGTATSGRTHAERKLLIKLGICWALAGNVMLLAFAFYAGLDMTNDPRLAMAARWMSLGLALPAVLYGGSEFFRRAWASLRMAWHTQTVTRLHIDTPIALGILVGFGHSAWATVSGSGEVWFDSITVLIAALLTARWIQLRSRRLAGDATERLLALIPQMMRRVRPDGTIEVVPADEVHAGDVVEVPAGEVIPVDGAIVSGTSSVNRAVLTGESRTERVTAGTTVEAAITNVTAPLHIRVQATGGATRVGRLLEWIQNRDAHRAPVVLLADRLGGFFVLAVLVLAAVTALVWSLLEPGTAARHIVALLVITCPCALGMATPLAMAVASGRAARAGIFIKSGAAIQQLTHTTAVVLDKTGTLTEGRMALVAWHGEAEALDLAAVLETHSNHPIADALVQARRKHSATEPEVLDVMAVAGQGIQGWVDGRFVRVGRPTWLADAPCFAAHFANYASSGLTPVGIEVDGNVVAVVAFGDRVRKEAAAMIKTLQNSGKAVYLLSGDHEAVVHDVAVSLGLNAETAFGAYTPEAKQAFVAQLQADGHTVAMIGDGVNDAAALQTADVGIAVEGGATPSLVAADVFLTRDGLRPVAELLDGSQRVMRVIRRTLGISLAYNALGATAALLGLVTPLVAAVAMPVSSLLVVVLAITQRTFALREHATPTLPASAPAPAVSTPIRMAA